jgi:hypothetical protein
MGEQGMGHNGGPALRDGNWVAISREIIDHHIVGAGQTVTPADRNRGAFSRLESWIDLLMLANFSERKISTKGVTTILGPGQTLAGRAFLARRWNWTEKTVRLWLDRLQKELMITLACETLKQGHSQGHTPNVLTICNWSKYQISEVAAGPPLGWPEGHPGATQGPNYNKEVSKPIMRAPPHADAGVPAREGKPFFEDPYDRAVLTDGKIELRNGFRQEWLDRFGGDPVSLDLALQQIVPYVEPNSRKTLETQVNAQLARIARQDREVAKRSEASRQQRTAPTSGRASILEAIDRINKADGK